MKYLLLSKKTKQLEKHQIIKICKLKNTKLRKHYIKKYKGKKIDENFSYNSKDNKYLTISNLRKLIKKV